MKNTKKVSELSRENTVRFMPPPVSWFQQPAGFVPARGSVTYPEGFLSSGISAGLKKKGLPDVALLVSEKSAVAAGCFTTNAVKAAPVVVCRRHLANPIHAVLMNAKCANSYTGKEGIEDALGLLSDLASFFGLHRKNFMVASTGVIGERLPVAKIRSSLSGLVMHLSHQDTQAARAIMTTDTVEKTAACRMKISGREVRIGAMAKGAGMIAPRMATMLAFATTDAVIRRPLLQKALDEAVGLSFNRITVDGDTSTNDTILCLANGTAGNREITAGSPGYRIFLRALTWVCQQLAWKVVSDGEGVTKVFEVVVEGAASRQDAVKAGRAVACSPLVKTAVFGEDLNWGRIVNAAGYSGAAFDPSRLDLWIGDVNLLRKGRLARDRLAAADRIIRKPFFSVRIGLNNGKETDRVLTTDFSYDYVRINADYRS